MSRMFALACALAAFAVAAGSAPAPASAQQASTPPYGPPITLDDAKRAMAAAELEAAKNSWQVAITIIDSGGNLVMFHKVDNTQLASIGASEGKARTALTFKRPSKALDDAIAAGGAGLRLLAVKDITPLEGGAADHDRRQDHRRRSGSPAHCPRRTRKSPRLEATRWRNSRAARPPIAPGIARSALSARERFRRRARSRSRRSPCYLHNDSHYAILCA